MGSQRVGHDWVTEQWLKDRKCQGHYLEPCLPGLLGLESTVKVWSFLRLGVRETLKNEVQERENCEVVGGHRARVLAVDLPGEEWEHHRPPATSSALGATSMWVILSPVFLKRCPKFTEPSGLLPLLPEGSLRESSQHTHAHYQKKLFVLITDPWLLFFVLFSRNKQIKRTKPIWNKDTWSGFL